MGHEAANAAWTAGYQMEVNECLRLCERAIRRLGRQSTPARLTSGPRAPPENTYFHASQGVIGEASCFQRQTSLLAIAATSCTSGEINAQVLTSPMPDAAWQEPYRRVGSGCQMSFTDPPTHIWEIPEPTPIELPERTNDPAIPEPEPVHA